MSRALHKQIGRQAVREDNELEEAHRAKEKEDVEEADVEAVDSDAELNKLSDTSSKLSNLHYLHQRQKALAKGEAVKHDSAVKARDEGLKVFKEYEEKEKFNSDDVGKMLRAALGIINDLSLRVETIEQNSTGEKFAGKVDCAKFRRIDDVASKESRDLQVGTVNQLTINYR